MNASAGGWDPPSAATPPGQSAPSGVSSPAGWLLNERTGRTVKVGGKTYQDLLQQGYQVGCLPGRFQGLWCWEWGSGRPHGQGGGQDPPGPAPAGLPGWPPAFLYQESGFRVCR